MNFIAYTNSNLGLKTLPLYCMIKMKNFLLFVWCETRVDKFVTSEVDTEHISYWTYFCSSAGDICSYANLKS